VTGERVRAPSPVEAWATGAAARGRELWPALAVSEAELVSLIELRRTLPGVRRAELDELDAAELYLAVACARGDRAAVVELRRRYFDGVIPQLRRMGLGAAQCDDVWQTVCERLLVATDGPPAIVRYVGTGELAGLMRVAATRLALNWLKQDQRRVTQDDWLDDLPAARADPELELSKQQHRAEIKQAIEAALETLVARDRMILRLHLVERLGIDAIARVSSVHRTTAARWIARAKETLALRVRDRLLARWRVSEASFPALRTLIDSQIDLSLERLLARE
jgi:RNA polymerase sigma-70 factor (ECF subfamily)